MSGFIDHKALCKIPLLQLERFPGIQRIDTSKAQLFVLDNFLTGGECDGLSEIINANLRPSTVNYANNSGRTSRTCDLSLINFPLIPEIDQKIAAALGINIIYSEGIQGQKYVVGEEFKPHTDFFEPAIPAHAQHMRFQGNRTWTFMVYLNDTLQGGGTQFTLLDQTFYPKKRRAVAWNNLNADGTPNRNTLHCGLPVEEGEKIIITKWFREKGMGDMFDASPKKLVFS